MDLLIGSDYYWWFATGETRRGEDGPVDKSRGHIQTPSLPYLVEIPILTMS